MHGLIHFEFLGECLNLTVAQMVFYRDACFPDITAGNGYLYWKQLLTTNRWDKRCNFTQHFLSKDLLSFECKMGYGNSKCSGEKIIVNVITACSPYLVISSSQTWMSSAGPVKDLNDEVKKQTH